MQYKVYHAKQPNFGMGPHIEFIPDNFQQVAVVVASSLNEVFQCTNHIDSPWWDNKGISWYKPESRSTSVGDVVEDETGKLFRCEMAGWTEMKGVQS